MPHRVAAVLLVALAAACGDELVTVETIDASMDVDAGAAVHTDVDAAVPSGDQCTDAVPITLAEGSSAARIFSTTELAADDYDIASCGGAATTRGPDRVFTITVAAGHRLVATVKGVQSSFDPALYVIKGPAEACAADSHTCLAASDVGPDGDYERVMYRNTSATAIDVYVVVDGAQGAGGAFKLDIWMDAIPPTPVGDTCALAEPVSLANGRATLRGTTSLFPGYNNDYAPHCAPFTENGTDHVYAVTVPPGKRLATTLSPKYSAAIYLLSSTCSDTCLGAASALPDEHAVVSYANTTSEPIDLFVVVDSARELTGGEYQLDVAFAD